MVGGLLGGVVLPVCLRVCAAVAEHVRQDPAFVVVFLGGVAKRALQEECKKIDFVLCLVIGCYPILVVSFYKRLCNKNLSISSVIALRVALRELPFNSVVIALH